MQLPAKSAARGRWLRRIGWVLLVAMMAIAATVYGVARRRSAERAELTLGASVTEGRQALDAGDFKTASQQFQRAILALDRLGRDDDSQARWIRQMSRESTAASHLAVNSLFDMVAEADQAHQQKTLGEWQQRFELMYAETWIVLQAELARTTDSRGRADYVLDYPLDVNGTAVEVDADLHVFRRLPPDPEPTPVLVAAQLQSCRRSTGDPATWIITLRADTAFLWTDPKNLVAIGLGSDLLHDDDGLKNLLARQAKLMGLE